MAKSLIGSNHDSNKASPSPAPQRAPLVTRRSLKLVVIPTEHGGWGFLLEPALLGLIVAPSWAGVLVALAMLAVFLVRQPLKLFVADRRVGKRYPRTVLAERLAFGFTLAALALFVAALLLSSGPLWLPVLIAAPFALLQAYFDTRRQSRQLAAELAGAVALGAGAPAIVLAASASAGIWSEQILLALGLWLVLATRSVASVLYVRARLALEKGQPANLMPAIASHVAGLIGVGVLALFKLAPWLALIALTILTVRAIHGLSPLRRHTRATVIGICEMLYGILTVALTAAGVLLHL